MKKLIFISLTILIITFLGSCRKEVAFSSVEGYVIEKGSNKRIPNARIRIQECQGEFLGSFSCSDIDTIYSDANGYYKYYKEFVGEDAHKSGWNTYLVVSKEKYSTYQVEDYAMPIRGTRIKDMILLPISWLKLHVKAVNQYGINDSFEVGSLTGSSQGEWFGKINNLDYIKYYERQGNDTIDVSWYIYKDLIKTKYQQKVYLPALDTTEFKLFF
jgi:hypothetical protein